MNKFLAIALAVTLTVAAPITAFAQDDNKTTQTGTIEGAAALDVLDTATSISVQKSGFAAPGAKTTLETAPSAPTADLVALRSRLEQSEPAMTALTNAKATPAQVVAITASSDGAVIIYVAEN